MTPKTPTTSLVLDTRKTSLTKDKKHPLSIRIGFNKNQSRKWHLGTHYYTKAEYQKIIRNKRKDPYKDINNEFDAILNRADSIVKALMPYFTFVEFHEQFFNDSSLTIKVDTTTLIYLAARLIAKYRARQQFAMTVKIDDTVASILKYSKTENLPMRAITPQFCRRYEEYMYKKSTKRTRNGAGITLRHVRIIYNDGISDGNIPRQWYPFKRRESERSEFPDAYVIPYERKRKDFLKEEEIVKFAEYNAFETRSQEIGHFAWLVSFYCNGANAADILKFKFKDIDGDYIMYYREKTINTTRTNRKLVKVYLGAELKELIKKYGNPPLPDNYIFPFYQEGMTEEEMYVVRRRFTTRVSKSLKYLAKNIGIRKNVRFGNARHSLGGIMKKYKIDREAAKDLFGHTNILQLENYMDMIDDDEHVELAKKYISIKGIKARLGANKASFLNGNELFDNLKKIGLNNQQILQIMAVIKQ